MTDYDFSGTHVIADIRDIDPDVIRDNQAILRAMDAGLQRSRATLCGLQVKPFEPAGLTVVYLLSESHASVHTYPEFNALFFDAFTCGSTCVPEAFLDALAESLGPCQVRARALTRGNNALPRLSDAVNLALSVR
jgi:S-adenosylmethionine decarboxylase